MTTARLLVADQIRDDHPNYRVDAYPNKPAQVTKARPYVNVYRAEITPRENGTLDHGVEIQVYVSETDADAAENALEDALDDVMLSLQRLDPVIFDKAERRVFHEMFAGWLVTCHVNTHNDYANAVRAENTGA